MLDEIRVGTERIVDTRVVVIGLRRREDGANTGALDRDGQAVDEGVVGRGIRSEEELPLGAAAGDHVSAAWQNRAWERHTDPSAIGRESCSKDQPGSGSSESCSKDQPGSGNSLGAGTEEQRRSGREETNLGCGRREINLGAGGTI